MPALSPEALDDCFAHDRDRLSHADATALIAAHARAIVGTVRVPLAEAVGRYAARDVSAPRPVPGHDNAAVDGYAVRHADLAGDASKLTVAQRVAAGDGRETGIGEGEAARIFTGARVPDGADTIVMQEDVDASRPGEVVIPAGVRHGANLRRAGEDVGAGDTVVGAGARLRPQDIAALASTGAAEISVFRPLRVGVLSSGDEVRRPGTALHPGEVYDANSFLLRALMAGLPVEPVDLGIVADRRELVEERLDHAAEACDLVITTGGASRGEEDHLVRALAETGELHAWQIAVKPGRPLGLGFYRGTRMLMLPGNPVAVMVCFLLYAMPMMARLGGGVPREPHRFPVAADFEIARKKADRREFLRGTLRSGEAGLTVVKYPRDGSGLISSLRAADGLIELAEPVTRVDRGDMVAFLPFSAFGVVAG